MCIRDSPYNLDYLKQVFQGNDAMVHRILDMFEVEVPRYFERMEALGRQSRWRELHPLAHKAKSSIGMLGMEALLSTVLEIEQRSRNASDDAALERFLSLARKQLDEAMMALKADRAQMAQGAAHRARMQEMRSRRGTRLHLSLIHI